MIRLQKLHFLKLACIFSFFISMPSLAWSMSSQEKFIQGEWTGQEEQKQNTPPPSQKGPVLGISVDWTFNKGNFKFIGYPPLKQEGKYRVAKESPDSITLELYDQKGDWGTEKMQKTFFIDRNKDQLKEQFLMNRRVP